MRTWCIKSPASSMCTQRQLLGRAFVIVRFLVGTPQEDALIKVYSKRLLELRSNAIGSFTAAHQRPAPSTMCRFWRWTLWGEHYDGYQLRANSPAEMQTQHREISDVVGDDHHRRTPTHHARCAEY